MSIADAISDGDIDYQSSGYGVLEDLRNTFAGGIFQIASALTEPVCKAREFYQRIDIIDALNSKASLLSNLARKISLFVGLVGVACLAVFTTIPGIALRVLGSQIQKQPFLYLHEKDEDKVLPADRSFTLLSWNICGISAGYTISDGGVLPLAFRIDELVRKIIEKDADVNCLNEVFDPKTAFYICEKLKQKGYHHFYFNIGPKAIGVSTGIFVASKYAIKNPKFFPFPKETLVGRTKHAVKGVFAFDLASRHENFARIYATHFQHSEEPQFPTNEEVQARRKHMQLVLDTMNGVRDRAIICTGDLNLDDAEFSAAFWCNYFQKADQFGVIDKTWGGDEFCARLVGKRVSGPLNLDYTMIFNNTARSIQTSLIQTAYDSTNFKKEALSDHKGLLSRIYVN